MKKSVLLLTLALAAALPASADSLFTKEVAKRGPAVSNKNTRFAEGDIIIVLVRENIDATTESNTNTKKESEIVAEAPVGSNTFLVAKKPDGLGLLKKERLPNWDIEVENEHKGRGDTSRSNRLTTTISCTVTKVFENGNLEIMGNKRVTVNSEDSTVLLTGTVRARDVSPENTVPSDRVANAIVELKGKGPLWNNQRRGILTKLLDWFSPF
ncbi:MAG TPA: flagellar basal body L-ring protein FlgH [Candidatus Hydrogenedentes bacterium]|nr:flagellar basal body L-ring protein FlgH [Candidatus Hydrogenedentota bacterium]HQE83311.1 flagellar basal body L-ring protein FlgH [Candidatus Hydrogenedentota bacterium]HQH53723.1 flagellar basal body L-ring protein FlgH [Candidatus Hydrogenedentota bacterium]HQM49313.1 flagellar basal body L-ring protein FlgH [Candidatus Hydrogenedentota bacterium]